VWSVRFARAGPAIQIRTRIRPNSSLHAALHDSTSLLGYVNLFKFAQLGINVNMHRYNS
jgi:hypothetical protein